MNKLIGISQQVSVSICFIVSRSFLNRIMTRGVFVRTGDMRRPSGTFVSIGTVHSSSVAAMTNI